MNNVSEIYKQFHKQEFDSFLEHYSELKDINFIDLYTELYGKFITETESRIRTIYPRFKEHAIEHFKDQIFSLEIQAKDIDNYFKIQFCGLLYVMKKYNKAIINERLYEFKDFQGIADYLRYTVFGIYSILHECEIFKEIKPVRVVGLTKRIDSLDTFISSKNLKHSYSAYSSLSSFNAAVFLIRQSIELKVKNILGIDVILDSNHKIIKILPEKLIDFVYNNDNIKLPNVSKSILKKIHNWTQYYIHGGWVLNIWLIDIAHDILNPLFNGGQADGTSSIYGSVIFNKEYYNADYKKDIKEYLISTCSLSGDIDIKFTSPEAILAKI